MRAMVIHGHGGPEQLVEAQMPRPEVGEQDVLIQVHACAMNPVDSKVRAGGLFEKPFPLILGYDVSGTVAEVGRAAADLFKVGDAVYASPSLARQGANAEFVAVDARTVAHKPESLDHLHAAALPLVTITAWEAMHHHAILHTGETVLIHGGAGGVGHIAIQLARLHGTKIIATAGREPSINFCKQLGADMVIDYSKEDVVKRIQQETDGKGCDVVLDMVGGDVFKQCIPCVAVNGRLVTILPPPADADISPLFIKSASIHMEFMGVPTVFDIRPESQGQILQTVTEMVDAGRLKPHVSKVFTLDQLADAHRMQETGHVMGKLAINVNNAT